MTTSQTGPDAPLAADLAALADLPVATVADALDRLYVVDSDISARWPGARLCGPAFTVLTRSGDNAAVHQAIEHLRPGDVLVVDGGGDRSRALIGELLARRVAVTGASGILVEGAVRDIDQIRELQIPVFARAVTPAGPYKHGPGLLQVPVAIGGVVVQPGDLVTADSDGVAILPSTRLGSVLATARDLLAAEERRRVDVEG